VAIEQRFGPLEEWRSLRGLFTGLAALGLVVLVVLDFKFTGGAITWTILNLVGRRGGGGGGRGGARGGGGSSGGGGASR
jgi:uncharacterized protein